MPRNPVRVRLNFRAPPLDPPATTELDGREEMMLAAIDPGGGYERSVFEIPTPVAVGWQRQLVNDKVNDVLGNVHRVGAWIVEVLVRDNKCGQVRHSRRGGRPGVANRRVHTVRAVARPKSTRSRASRILCLFCACPVFLQSVTHTPPRSPTMWNFSVSPGGRTSVTGPQTHSGRL